MTEYRDWSITASANTGNAVDGYFKENMAYSDVNDAAREFQAILARDRLDKNGTLVSTGATSSYIVTINATLSAYQDGDIVAFQAHAKNDGASTLTIRHPGGSLSARPMVKTDLSALANGDLVAGGMYEAYYNSSSANFRVANLPFLPQDTTWTPALSFATPGDLSLSSYTTQVGNFWRIGNLVFYHASIVVTPTFTTASGAMELSGLPYSGKGTGVFYASSCFIGATGFALGSDTAVTAGVNGGQTTVKFITYGAGASSTITASNFTSGNEVTIHVTGFYPLA